MTLTVDVRNLGSRVDQAHVDVLGPCTVWATVVPTSLNLLPSAHQTVDVSIALPDDMSVSAGTYAFEVRATSSVNPRHSVTQPGALDVLPVLAFDADMSPKMIRGSSGEPTATSTIRVANTGNADLSVRLVAQKVTDTLDVTVVPQQLRIRHLDEATATAYVRPHAAFESSGRSYTSPFAISVEAAGKRRRFDGTYTAPALPPTMDPASTQAAGVPVMRLVHPGLRWLKAGLLLLLSPPLAFSAFLAVSAAWALITQDEGSDLDEARYFGLLATVALAVTALAMFGASRIGAVSVTGRVKSPSVRQEDQNAKRPSKPGALALFTLIPTDSRRDAFSGIPVRWRRDDPTFELSVGQHVVVRGRPHKRGYLAASSVKLLSPR